MGVTELPGGYKLAAEEEIGNATALPPTLPPHSSPLALQSLAILLELSAMGNDLSVFDGCLADDIVVREEASL